MRFKKEKQNCLDSVYLTIQRKNISKKFFYPTSSTSNDLEMIRKKQCRGRQTVGKNRKKTIKWSRFKPNSRRRRGDWGLAKTND